MTKTGKPSLPPAHDWRTTDTDEINGSSLVSVEWMSGEGGFGGGHPGT